MSQKEAKKYASTEHEGLPEKKKGKKKKKGEKVNEEAVCPKCGKCPCECDRRDKKTYRDLLKNKIRSMGVRNPILLDDADEKKVMKAMTSSSAKMNENAATYTAAQATDDQEAAKEAAQKRREAAKAAKPQSAIEREGAVDRRTLQLGREAMRRAFGDGTRSTGGLRP